MWHGNSIMLAPHEQDYISLTLKFFSVSSQLLTHSPHLHTPNTSNLEIPGNPGLVSKPCPLLFCTSEIYLSLCFPGKDVLCLR